MERFPLLSRMDLKLTTLIVFFNWWLRQVTELLPAGLIRAVRRHHDAAIVDVGDEGVSLLMRRDGVVSCLSRSHEGNESGYRQIAELIARMEAPPRQLLLRLPSAMILKKLVSFPLAARRDLESLIGFEMDRETPFGRNEVYWNYVTRKQDPASGRLDVELFIVPRPFVEPILAGAKAGGLEPTGIELDTDSDRTQVIRLGAVKRWEWLLTDRKLVNKLGIAAGVLFLAIVIPLIYQEIMISIDDSRISGLKDQAREASALRQTVDQANGVLALVAKERARCGGTLDVLAATTRLVPDDSHLTALSLRSGRLTITGLSPAAARLVDLLAQSAAFREPSFDSPVVQNDESGLETFTISASLSPDGLKEEARKIGQEQKSDGQTEAVPKAGTPKNAAPKSAPPSEGDEGGGL